MQRELDEQYPDRHPRKVDGGLMDAADQAKRELKFLLVVLHNPKLQQSVRFVKETLCSEAFVTFSDGNLVLWAESLADKRGYANAMQLQAMSSPFLALVTFVDGQMKVVWRRSGFMSAPAVLETLTGLMEQYQPALIAEEHERSQRSMDRILRQQQEEEYEASLRKDREKVEAAAAEKAKIEREKQEAIDKAGRRTQELAAKKAALPAEPAAGEPQVKLKLKFPNGTAHDRIFSPDTAGSGLYAFVDTREGSGISEDFSIYTQFPRQLLEDSAKTLAAYGMKGGRDVLTVQDNSV
jgi:FAS-associated factor 2